MICLMCANFLVLTQFYLMSNDDKAKIPLEANLQASILMHMEYKVKLIDCDIVVGPHHKLIPSIY